MKDLHVEIDDRGNFGQTYKLAAWWVEPEGYAVINFEIKRGIEDGADFPHIKFNSRQELEEFLLPFLRLAEKLGIKGPEAAEIRGELKATKAHLEDLRNLIEKPVSLTLGGKPK